MQIVNDTGSVLSDYLLARPERVTKRSHRGLTLDMVVFSDWRVQKIDTIKTFVADGPRPDLILYAGDDVSRFHTADQNYFEELAEKTRYGLCAVAGNDDPAECRDLIVGRKVHAVHSRPLVLGPFAVVGLEGAPLFHDNPGLNLGSATLPAKVSLRVDQVVANALSRQEIDNRFPHAPIWRFGFRRSLRTSPHRVPSVAQIPRCESRCDSLCVRPRSSLRRPVRDSRENGGSQRRVS